MPGVGIAVAEDVVLLAVVDHVETGDGLAGAAGAVGHGIGQGEGHVALLVDADPAGQVGTGGGLGGAIGGLFFRRSLGGLHAADVLAVHHVHPQGQAVPQHLAGHVTAVPLPFDGGVNARVQGRQLHVQGIEHGDVALHRAAHDAHPGRVLGALGADVVQRVVQVHQVVAVGVASLDLGHVGLVGGQHLIIAGIVVGIDTAARCLGRARIGGAHVHLVARAVLGHASVIEAPVAAKIGHVTVGKVRYFAVCEIRASAAHAILEVVRAVHAGGAHAAAHVTAAAPFAGAALGIAALDERLGLIGAGHRGHRLVGQGGAVGIEPGPVSGIVQVVHVPLKVLGELRQVQVQVAAAVPVGVGVLFRVIFDGQRHRAGHFPVAVQVEAHLRLIHGQVLGVDVVHVFIRKYLRQRLLEISVEIEAGGQGVLHGLGHVRLVERGDGAIGHAAPGAVGQLDLLAVDGDGGGIAAVGVFVHAHRAHGDLVVVEIGVIRSRCEHGRVSPAAAAAGGHPVIHAARQVAQQYIVFHKAGRRLLVDQAGGGVAGIGGFPRLIREAVLLAPVAAGHVDVALGGVGGRGQGIRGIAVARRAGVQDHRGRGRGVGLAVGAGDLCGVIDHQAALYSVRGAVCGHVRRPVAVDVDAGDIGPGHAHRHALLIRDDGLGHRRHHRQRPGVAFGAVGPFLAHIRQVQRRLDGRLVGSGIRSLGKTGDRRGHHGQCNRHRNDFFHVMCLLFPAERRLTSFF